MDHDILYTFFPSPAHQRVRRVVLAKVYLDRPKTTVIVQTATVTLVDMISNIGGTLGLFCGFSILSAVEVVYWAGKSLLATDDKTRGK